MRKLIVATIAAAASLLAVASAAKAGYIVNGIYYCVWINPWQCV